MLGYSWASQKILQGTAEPGMMAQACNSCLWNLKQDCRFRTSPGYTLRPCLKNQTTTKKTLIEKQANKPTKNSWFFLKDDSSRLQPTGNKNPRVHINNKLISEYEQQGKPPLLYQGMIGFKDGHDATIMAITDWGNSQKMAYQVSWHASLEKSPASVSLMLRL